MAAGRKRQAYWRTSVAIWTLIVAAMVTTPCLAGTYEDSIAAYYRGDFAETLRLLRPLADGGNALAQTRLALLYANGQGVRQDYSEAVKWERRAAEQGLPQAQANLRFCVQERDGRAAG